MAANDGGEPLGAVGRAILDLAPKMAALGAEEIRLERIPGEVALGVTIRYTIAPECEACGKTAEGDAPESGGSAASEMVRRALAEEREAVH